MPEVQNILIVDDHPVVADAYINLIASSDKETKFNFLKAINSEVAFKKIGMIYKSQNSLYAAVVDINLPPYLEENIKSGTDLALIIRKQFPTSKIIILTMHTEALLLNNVLKLISPEGFISKNDVDFKTFPNVFSKIMNGENFISNQITNSLGILYKKNIKWDEIDCQIITLLNEGVKTKDMPNFIQLSLSAIEKRKATIKQQLINKQFSDEKLIELAKKFNLI